MEGFAFPIIVTDPKKLELIYVSLVGSSNYTYYYAVITFNYCTGHSLSYDYEYMAQVSI